MKGKLKALPLSDSIQLLKPDSAVLLLTSEGVQEIKKIKSIKKHNKYFIISFYEVPDVASAAKYRGSTINLKRDLLKGSKEDEYFYDQIIGLSVYTTEGNIIGKVADIFETGSNDVYVVKNNNKEYLIPAIRDVIKRIELEEGRIIISVINGMLD